MRKYERRINSTAAIYTAARYVKVVEMWECEWKGNEGQRIEHQPMTSLDYGGPIEFVVHGTGDAYNDLARTYLFVRAKIIRGVGTNLADDTPVAPVNNWLHSLFSQVDLYINDTLVTPSSITYPFRAYVETLVSYGAEANKTQLTSQLWYNHGRTHGHDARERW